MSDFPAIGPTCERGGEIVDHTIGLCSCGECPTPRPDWLERTVRAAGMYEERERIIKARRRDP